MVIRPLRDQLLVKRDDYAHRMGLYVHGASTNKGVVLAAGPGKRVKRFVYVKHPMTGNEFRVRLGAETGVTMPMEIKVGDHVEFSANGQIEVPGTDGLILIQQGSVIGYADDASTEGLQFHASAIDNDACELV